MSWANGAGTATTPGGAGSNLTVNRWQRGLGKALYDKQRFIPRLARTAEKIGNQLGVRRLSRVGYQTMSNTSDGTDVSFNDLAPTLTNITPTWVLTGAAYPDSMPRRMGDGDNIRGDYANNLTSALAAGLESIVLQNVVSATYTIGNSSYNIEAAGMRYALALLTTNTRFDSQPGDEINMILDAGQIAPSLAIPEINAAWQRGDGVSPQVTGKMSTGYGLTFMYTTLTASSGGAHYGAIWVPECISYNYNEDPTAEAQRFLKQTRLLEDAEIGSAIIYQERLIGVQTA